MTEALSVGAALTPGTLIARRYRIVSLLARGGMGEVYRADDTKLSQQVALKFLPSNLASDPTRVERLLTEVRLGREITHPSVCRTHDVLEWEDQHLIVMEYVDGEDLASLLKRIGRLPYQKALEVARDVCAGLHAAHERGIIHRDLKPANVMIDGRGRARITDFGLAVFGGVTGTAALAGTPAYMAPEQLLGDAATIESDIYSLGLVLYELFTGTQLFSGTSVPQIIAQHATPKIEPSAIAPEIAPQLESIIMSCLEEEPELRPSSALAVGAALPVRDAISAAVHGGETPSPELVAAAAERGDLPLGIAAAGAATLVVATLLLAYLRPHNSLYGFARIDKRPEVLEDRAREIATRLGYPHAVDTAVWFDRSPSYVAWAHRAPTAEKRIAYLRSKDPGAVRFWYTQHADWLRPMGEWPTVHLFDPPMTQAGLVRIVTDTSGRLRSFQAIPPYVKRQPGREPDWKVLFVEAGLDFSRFTPTPPMWRPHGHDVWRAWRGPDVDGSPVVVDAAAFEGRVVSFGTSGLWSDRGAAAPPRRRAPPPEIYWIFLLALIGAATVVAWTNWRNGRGDRQGAVRLAMYTFGIYVAAWVLAAHHVPTLHEVAVARRGIATALLRSAQIFIAYLAVEPFVRRRWPRILIGWSRLMSGRIRDPMVGRDILLGLTVAVLMLLGHEVFALLKHPRGVLWSSVFFLGQPARQLERALTSQSEVILVCLAFLLYLLLLRAVIRNDHAAGGVWVLSSAAAIGTRYTGSYLVNLMGFAVAGGVLYAILRRFGLLPVVVMVYVIELFGPNWRTPLTLDTSTWFFGESAVAIGTILAVGIFAAKVASREGFRLTRLLEVR